MPTLLVHETIFLFVCILVTAAFIASFQPLAEPILMLMTWCGEPCGDLDVLKEQINWRVPMNGILAGGMMTCAIKYQPW